MAGLQLSSYLVATIWQGERGSGQHRSCAVSSKDRSQTGQLSARLDTVAVASCRLAQLMLEKKAYSLGYTGSPSSRRLPVVVESRDSGGELFQRICRCMQPADEV